METFLIFSSIAKTLTGSSTISEGLTNLGKVANTISGFLTGVVWSAEP